MPVIYKITSPSGKVYIGQSWNFKKRLDSYKGLHCLHQRHLYNSFIKYGYENHTIEILCEMANGIDQFTLDFLEIYFYNHFRDLDFVMMNLKEPGKGGKLSEETKRRIGERSLNRRWTDETRRKWRESRSKSGYTHSKETASKIGQKHKGMHRSLETRRKMSEAGKGKKILPERIAKRIDTMIKNKQLRRVININTNEVYLTIPKAAIANGISDLSLWRKLTGKTINNTPLRYYDDVHSSV